MFLVAWTIIFNLYMQATHILGRDALLASIQR